MADPTFNEVLTAAMNDVEEHGFLNAEQIAEWERKLAEAAKRSFTPEATMKMMLEKGLIGLYNDMVEKGKILRYHPGVQRFTLEKIKPYLRPELDKRIAVSLSLIRLNKEATVAKMKQRFSGWASSVPAGGGGSQDKREAKETVKKGIAGLSYESRRVLIDQSSKLISSINAVLAEQGNAIAGIWRSHAGQAGYDFRVEHEAREIESMKRPYLMPDSWALRDGLISRTGATYINKIEQPGEFPYCRCFYTYLYNIRQLPRDMLTKAGIEFLENAARKRAAYV
jgi:hypothetical protein